MNVKLIILLSLFSISLAYAHPNHMSFEAVQHQAEQLKDTHDIANQLSHSAVEKQGHQEVAIPCKQQQHKAAPCKRK